MSYCKTCQKEYYLEYYSSRKQEHNLRRYRNQQKARHAMQKALRDLKNKPCADCGEKHPYWAMDFDHLRPEEKLFSLGDASSAGKTLKSVLIEATKCDIVCALCHRYRTYGQKRGVAQSG